MKNKVFIIVMAMAAMIASSCRKTSETITPSQPLRGAAVAASEPSGSMAKNGGKPFKGNVTLTLNNALSLPCNCGSLIDVGNFEGSGNITHMGKMSLSNKTCAAPIIVSGNHVGNRITVTCGTFTAANGDIINVNIPPYDIMFTNTAAVGTLNAEFNGGTGRFTDASGSFTATVTIAYSNPNTVLFTNINGALDY